MYVCGITAYDYCHIGHARSVLAFDMIYRYLRYRGYKVTYVRNFTDIDDKIINRAREQDTTPDELSERFIRKFHEDMEQLGVASPTIEPKATEHVQEIIAMIKELVDQGGKLHIFLAGFEAIETFLFVPNKTTKGPVHVRDANDMKRALIIILIAMVPAILFGMWNTGFHHFQALGQEAAFGQMLWFGFLKILPL